LSVCAHIQYGADGDDGNGMMAMVMMAMVMMAMVMNAMVMLLVIVIIVPEALRHVGWLRQR
jgi:hypothetical protein